MNLHVFRYRDGYLVVEVTVDPRKLDDAQAAWDYVGEFHASRLAPDVQARVVQEIADRGYALIGQNELMLE